MAVRLRLVLLYNGRPPIYGTVTGPEGQPAVPLKRGSSSALIAIMSSSHYLNQHEIQRADRCMHACTHVALECLHSFTMHTHILQSMYLGFASVYVPNTVIGMHMHVHWPEHIHEPISYCILTVQNNSMHVSLPRYRYLYKRLRIMQFTAYCMHCNTSFEEARRAFHFCHE